MNTRQRTVALILLIVISLSLTQNLAFAAGERKSQGSITIIASGTATPIGNSENSTSPANSMLSLTGSISSAAENTVGFYGLTGILHIGQIGYLISDGQGQTNPNGTMEIQATTNGTVGIGDESGNWNNGTQMQLVLNGSMQGNNVTFDSKESKLASLDLLSLAGQVDVYLFSINAAGSSQTASESSGNETSSVETSNNQSSNNQASSVTTNSPQIAIQANTTLTQTEASNHTVTETVGNQTVTQSITQPNATITVTVTQVQNLTITQSETVTSGNMTSAITQTTTLTNVTITATATVTVANQTVTVTTT